MDLLADNLMLAGAIAAALVGAVAWAGDHRRRHRRDLDRVGITPWRDLAFWSSLAALLLLAGAFRDWLGR